MRLSAWYHYKKPKDTAGLFYDRWSGRYRKPRNSGEKIAAKKRTARLEKRRQKGWDKPQRLSNEEQVAAAMLDWPQCTLCKSRMRPNNARAYGVCQPCKRSKITCGICQDTRGFDHMRWATNQQGVLVAICYTCQDEHGVQVNWRPAGALAMHDRIWRPPPILSCEAGELRIGFDEVYYDD